MSKVQVSHSWRWWDLARVNRDCHEREWSHSIVSDSPRKDKPGYYRRFFFGDFYNNANAPDSDMDWFYFYDDNPDSSNFVCFSRAAVIEFARKLLELAGESK